MSNSDSPFLGVEASVSGKRWRERVHEPRMALMIAQDNDLPELLGRVLSARGVEPDAVAGYLNPTLRDLMPPALAMRDLDKGAERIADAIMAGEQVGLIGDYDVDGISSSALFRRFFASAGRELHVHIPNRLNEGYGPSTQVLERFHDKGITLAITVDCGVSAHEPLSRARELGIDVVVVDHHQAGEQLPDAHAVINPNRLDDVSGQGQLAAVGVSFVLLSAVRRVLRDRGVEGGETDLLSLLDLTALATVCDVVPLTGLNRALVSQGFKVMAKRENAGLNALADGAGLRRKPDTYAAGFVIGPRINAAGRLGHAELGLELLTTNDRSRANAIARELEDLNKRRQAIEMKILDDALAQGEAALGRNSDLPALVVTGEGWHPGVLGLVAGRIKDRLNLPVIAIGFEADGSGQASGRSVAGVDLGSAVRDAVAAGHLVKGGGHAMAAGMTLERARLGDFRAFLEDALSETQTARQAGLTLHVDGALSAGGATMELLELIEHAGPFGAGNPQPRFVFPGHRIAYSDLVGREHVKCTLQSGEGAKLDAIAFRVLGTPLGELLLSEHDRPLHIAGRLSINDWGGRQKPQLMVDDAVLAE